MDHSCSITVVNGKLAKTVSDAIVITRDPYGMFFRKIDREIRGSQDGLGRAYYSQLPIDNFSNLSTFIAKGDYEIEVGSTKCNIEACACPSCKNYNECKQLLLCSKETEKTNCMIAPAGCICQKCSIRKSHYLRKKCYCKVGKAKPITCIKYPDLIFVSDRCTSRLSEVVSTGLSSADHAGYKNIALPPFRCEVMWKSVENSSSEKSREIAIGINQYFLDHPDPKIESIKIVVDNNSTIYTELILEIEKHKVLKAILENKRPGIASTLKNMFRKRSIFEI